MGGAPPPEKQAGQLMPSSAPAGSGSAAAFHPVQVVAAGVLLEPYSLTIGFARRFATYKRGNLIMRDIDRLLRIVNNADHAGADHLCRQGPPGR